MKAILCAATLLVIAITVVQCNPAVQQLRKQCMDETKLTQAEMKEVMSNTKNDNPNENIKCFSKCMLEKPGHMVNGQFNADALLETFRLVPQMKNRMPELTSSVNVCKDLKGTNDCDTAFKILRCLKEHKAVIGAN